MKAPTKAYYVKTNTEKKFNITTTQKCTKGNPPDCGLSASLKKSKKGHDRYETLEERATVRGSQGSPG